MSRQDQLDFSERLQKIFIERDLIRREVAERAGCTGATLGRWLRGEVPFCISILSSLHNDYGIDLNYLITGVKGKRSNNGPSNKQNGHSSKDH